MKKNQRQTQSKKKRTLIVSLILAAIMVLGATFAWFTATDNVTNHLKASSYGDAKITEIFDSGKPLEPGANVDKKVGVVNTGAIDAIVRMSFAEALTLLANDGEATTVSTMYNGAAGIFPKLFQKSGTYAGWTELEDPDANFSGVTAFLAKIPGVTVLYNKTTVSGKDFYEFTAYATLGGDYAGQYQCVDIDITLSSAATPVIDLKGSVGYYQFTQAPETTGKWAALSAAHAPFNAYAAITPAGTLPNMVSGLDTTNAYLKLVFGSQVTTNLGAATVGQWWFAPDGYFYYVGKLTSGQQTTYLLEAVSLDLGASAEYFTLDYKLTPCMDAVQAIDAAVTGEWGTATEITDFVARLKALSVID